MADSYVNIIYVDHNSVVDLVISKNTNAVEEARIAVNNSVAEIAFNPKIPARGE